MDKVLKGAIFLVIFGAIIAVIYLPRGEMKLKENPEITLKGIPISAEVATSSHHMDFAIVIKIEGGDYVLCNAVCSYNNDWGYRLPVEAKAVVQSEIDDGDEEEVLLKGGYRGDKFGFTSVTANGLTIGIR